MEHIPPPPWGKDDLTALINKEVEAMPDRPPVVVVIIFYTRNADAANAEALRPLAQNHFSTHELMWLSVPTRVTYLGFDSADSPAFYRLWSVAAALPRIDEMAVYIKGVAAFRLERIAQVT
jgi:hypothetical protein